MSEGALAQLLGCYLHEDWRQEFASVAAAMAAARAAEPPEDIAAAAAELRALMGAVPDGPALQQHLEALGCSAVDVDAAALLRALED